MRAVLIGLGVIGLSLAAFRGGDRVSPRAREAALRTDLQTMRYAINDYTLDRHQPPKSLQDLVDGGYLREIPVDPITTKPDWALDFERPVLGDPVVSPVLNARGLHDIHSRSTEVAIEGSQYNTW